MPFNEENVELKFGLLSELNEFDPKPGKIYTGISDCVGGKIPHHKISANAASKHIPYTEISVTTTQHNNRWTDAPIHCRLATMPFEASVVVILVKWRSH